MDKFEKNEKGNLNIYYRASITYITIFATTWILFSTPILIGNPIASATTATEDSAAASTQFSSASSAVNVTNANTSVAEIADSAVNVTNANTSVAEIADFREMINVPRINMTIGEIGPGTAEDVGVNATNANTNIADIGGVAGDIGDGVLDPNPDRPIRPGDVAGDIGDGVLNPDNPIRPPPEIVHLRIAVLAVKVYDDHDGSWRGDGEWHLMGIVNGKPFKQVGQPDGEIDTPQNAMDDVRGEFRGNWGTAEQVNFNLLFVDVDINNTNPRQELRFDFFGIEQDGSGGIPDVPESLVAIGGDPVQYADAVRDVAAALYAIQDKNYLGSFQKIFTKDDNWWVGTHIISSDMTYSNRYYPEQNCEYDTSFASCPYVDWPDFSDWVMAVQVTDLDGPRCVDGYTYQYRTNICTQNQ